MRQEIAVIGGGAKAAAIAAKAAALRATRKADVHVTIIERAAIGANWDGGHGYTDGVQPLCTPAERDLGFPYDVESYGDEVAAHMQGHYSWMAHSVGDLDYSLWVDRGSPRPTHSEFAAYLRSAVKNSRARVIPGTCIGLERRGSSWSLAYQEPDQDDSVVRLDGFDGVVVTSPGPQKRVGTLEDHRIFDGESFWRHLADIRAVAERGGRIVIIGSGGTAAAVAAWFVNAGFPQAEMRIVARRPTFYTRTSNLFENRVFSDEDLWEAMGSKQRKDFNERLTRGAVWDAVTSTLERATNLAFQVGDVKDFRIDDDGDGTEPELVVEFGKRENDLPADLVVNATGFDAWWFSALLPADMAEKLEDREAIMASMTDALAFADDVAPDLHAPFLSGMVGPGFTSLMVLGAMADRILKPYVIRSTT